MGDEELKWGFSNSTGMHFGTSFSQYGKIFAAFSTVWKTFGDFFHAMENFLRIFPQYGKLF